MEKRKSNPPDRVDKPEIKKERSFPRSIMSTSASEVSTTKSHLDSDDVWIKDKDKSPRSDTASHTCPVSPTITPSTPAYVPYRLYSQLLDRVSNQNKVHVESYQEMSLRLILFKNHRIHFLNAKTHLCAIFKHEILISFFNEL